MSKVLSTFPESLFRSTLPDNVYFYVTLVVKKIYSAGLEIYFEGNPDDLSYDLVK